MRTPADALAEFLRDVARNHKLPRPVESATYVLPHIGRRKLGRLTVSDIELVLDRAAGRGLSESSLRGLRNAISASLNEAVRSRDLRNNVARGARLPEVAATEVKDRSTLDEVVALLHGASGSEIQELLALLVCTGCRIGEALGARGLTSI